MKYPGGIIQKNRQFLMNLFAYGVHTPIIDLGDPAMTNEFLAHTIIKRRVGHKIDRWIIADRYHAQAESQCYYRGNNQPDRYAILIFFKVIYRHFRPPLLNMTIIFTGINELPLEDYAYHFIVDL